MSARLPRPVRRARLGQCRRRGRGWTAREQISLQRPRGGRMTAMRRRVQWFARRACGLLGALAVAGIALAAPAPAASADATLVFTSPAAHSAVAGAPGALTLAIDEQQT